MTDTSVSYGNPTPDVESDCIGEVQAPNTVEETLGKQGYMKTPVVSTSTSVSPEATSTRFASKPLPQP